MRPSEIEYDEGDIHGTYAINQFYITIIFYFHHIVCQYLVNIGKCHFHIKEFFKCFSLFASERFVGNPTNKVPSKVFQALQHNYGTGNYSFISSHRLVAIYFIRSSQIVILLLPNLIYFLFFFWLHVNQFLDQFIKAKLKL